MPGKPLASTTQRNTVLADWIEGQYDPFRQALPGSSSAARSPPHYTSASARPQAALGSAQCKATQTEAQDRAFNSDPSSCTPSTSTTSVPLAGQPPPVALPPNGAAPTAAAPAAAAAAPPGPGGPPPPSPGSAEAVLFRHYLELVQRDHSRGPMQPVAAAGAAAQPMKGPPGWNPTGVASLFLALCPELGALDLLALTQTLTAVFSACAPLISRFNWLLVLPMLWAVRVLYVDSSPAVAILAALAGFGLMVAAEQVTAAQAAQQADGSAAPARRQTRRYRGYPHALLALAPAAVAAAAAVAAPGAVPVAAAAAVASAATAAATGNPDGPGATAAAGAPSGSGPPSSSGSHPNPSSRPTSSHASGAAAQQPRAKEDPAVPQVRALLIQLEGVLYGNELTDGLLPLDALPSRTQKLCEEVGLTFKTNGCTPADMLKALKEVQEVVGV